MNPAAGDPVIVLAGNPNTGKSTIFNALTGQRQHISNWAGTTVACKRGFLLLDGQPAELVDLPGAYSLSPYSAEERIARDFLLHNRIDLLVNVVDAANLERNLYLTAQLIETGLPLVVVLNKSDVVARRGAVLAPDQLSRLLGVPVIVTAADSGVGLATVRGQIAAAIRRSERRQPSEAAA